MTKDGTVPSAGAANAETYVQLFQIITQQPELAQQFDVTRLFTRIANMLGDKNAFDFVRKGGDVNAVTLGDEKVQQQAQAGNLIPANTV